MTSEVKFVLKGIRKEYIDKDIESEEISLFTNAKYKFINNKHIVEYSEINENDEELFSILNFDDKLLTIDKKSFSSHIHLIFDLTKKESICVYSTKEGNIDMKISTYEYSLNEDMNKLVIDLKYYISMNEYLVSDNILQIDIESKI